MKILKLLQRSYAIMGISPSKVSLNQSTQKCPFNGRIIFGFLLYGCVILSQFMYIFYVANDFLDYVESIIATTSTIIMFICFAAMAPRKTKLFESIENIEKLIDMSECQYF